MLFGKLFTNPKMWVNGDADEITMGGVYTCKDVQNVPTGDGALFVFKTENTVKQVFIPVGEEGVVYTRVLGEEWASVTGTSEETEALIQSAIDKANQAQAKADVIDTRLNNIILESGTSDAEVVAARTDSSGQTFSTLGVRLDTQFSEIKEDLSESVSDLKSAISVVITPENWFNIDGFELGQLKANGTVTESESYRYTKYYIPVTAGQTVYFRRMDMQTGLYLRNVAVYNAAKEIVGNLGKNTSAPTFSVPEGAVYVRVTIDVSSTIDNRSPMIAVSTSAPTAYSPYFDPFTIVKAPATYVTPEMFGAKGTGYSDDTAALQNAVNFAASHNMSVLCANTYAITESVTAKGVITGSGTIKYLYADDDTQRMANAFFMSSEDLTVDGLTFDCKCSKTFTVDDKFTKYNNAIRHSSGKLHVKNCTFVNIYNIFVSAHDNATSGVIIENCTFDATNKSNRFMSACVSVSCIIRASATIVIKNNIFMGYSGTDDTLDNACAILSSNTGVKSFTITGNTLVNMGRLATYDGNVGYSRLCAIDFYFRGDNIIISDNNISLCNWTPIRLHGVKHVRVLNNDISIKQYINESVVWISDAKNSSGEEPYGTEDVVIQGNNIHGGHAAVAFQVNSIPRHETAESSITDVIIKDNTVARLNAEYTILLDDSVKSIDISGNIVKMKANRVSESYAGTKFLMAASGDYANTEIKVLNNDIYIPSGDNSAIADGIYLVSATDIAKANIENNTIFAETGNCIIGTGSSDTIIAYSNIVKGGTGIKNIGKAVENIADCDTNYDSIGIDANNYPSI